MLASSREAGLGQAIEPDRLPASGCRTSSTNAETDRRKKTPGGKSRGLVATKAAG